MSAQYPLEISLRVTTSALKRSLDDPKFREIMLGIWLNDIDSALKQALEPSSVEDILRD